MSIGPDLDSTTAQACLKELREQCLYLHFDGARYCFKRDPNVTLLVEQEADAVARDEGRVRARIRALIEERLAGQPAHVWPERSADVPDRDARFLIAYLPLEFAAGLRPSSRRPRAICARTTGRGRASTATVWRSPCPTRTASGGCAARCAMRWRRSG